jgi:hypothetical protein
MKKPASRQTGQMDLQLAPRAPATTGQPAAVRRTRPAQGQTGPRTVVVEGHTFQQIRAEVQMGRFERGGVLCPCCDKLAQVYARNISTNSVRILAQMDHLHRRTGKEWLLVSDGRDGDIRTAGGDYAKMRFWGLIENQTGHRDDGSRRNGHWRVTEYGREFLRGLVRVRRYLYEYNSELVGDPDYADRSMVSVRDIDTGFNYEEILPDGQGGHADALAVDVARHGGKGDVR